MKDEDEYAHQSEDCCGTEESQLEQSPPARAPAATAFEGAKRPAGGGITEPQARVG